MRDFVSTLLCAASILLAAVKAHSAEVALPESFTQIARATFVNATADPGLPNTAVTTALQGAKLDPALDPMGFQGHDGDGGASSAFLSEFSVGQTFAPWTAYSTYDRDVAAAVRSKLYPAGDATYENVNKSMADGGTAFRYRVLLYGRAKDEAGNFTTDITNHFEQIDNWYGQPERDEIAKQIRILRVALANAPYSTELRNLFLDAHTDRAVAELQFVKQKLVTLAEKRLGITTVSEFIIDEEIQLLQEITSKLRETIKDFRTLLTESVEGIGTADVDPSAKPGTPFGYYVFQTQQPKRNATATRFFEATGANETPDNTATQTPLPVAAGEPPRPDDDILFEGYKDYRTLLEVMSQLADQSAELNRLRGMRQLPAGGSSLGDLEIARKEISTLLTRMPDDLCRLEAMFDDPAEFYTISTISSSTSSDTQQPLSNLHQGPGIGFDQNEPFEKGSGDWLTTSAGANASGAIDYFETQADPVLVIDLGAEVPLSEISVWGVEDVPSNKRHGVSSFKLRFATAEDGPGGFADSILYEPTFTVANNGIARQSFSLGTEWSARYVEFTALDNFWKAPDVGNADGGNRVALGEIAFQKPSNGAKHASGVFAARNSVEQSLSELVGVRSFLSGTTNILGLDSDFIVFLQDPEGDKDSYEIFVDEAKGPNKPVTVALEKLAFAKDQYSTFRESVDRVKEELSSLETTHKNRFYNITGYTTKEAVELIDDPSDPRNGLPKWDGMTPLAGSGSELDVVSENIRLLKERLVTYKGLQDLFQVAHLEADRTVSTASNLDAGIDAAKNEYLDKSGFYFDALAVSNAVAASAQAATDATFAAAGLDGAATFFTAGATAFTVAAAGTANTLAQGTNAGLSRYFEKQIDAAAFAFQTTTQKQDNALTFQQALDAKQDLLREEQGALAESQELISALTQAESLRGSLLDELVRIKAALTASTALVRSKYYADPIHFLRSENALLDANARFREAQRWLFLTQNALAHKWTQSFAIKSGGKSYDHGSIFRMRNATELDNLLTAYNDFNADRITKFNTTLNDELTAIVSFKDRFLAPNPKRNNATDTTDDGTRVDLATGDTVSQDELFRRKLERSMDSVGNIRLRFNTATLANVEGLFLSPSLNPDGSILAAGEWRDKIEYVAVNIIGKDADPASQPLIVNGSLSYGGMTVFRTPIPPNYDIDQRLVLPAYAEQSDGLTRFNPFTGQTDQPYTQPLDRPGEFITAPYRYFTPNLLGNGENNRNIDKLYQADNSQVATARLAYWHQSARIAAPDPAQEVTLGTSFQLKHFRELSVAATNWELVILNNSVQPNQQVSIDQIEDIELIIRHRSYQRLKP